jgi:hypothetical protein
MNSKHWRCHRLLRGCILLVFNIKQTSSLNPNKDDRRKIVRFPDVSAPILTICGLHVHAAAVGDPLQVRGLLADEQPHEEYNASGVGRWDCPEPLSGSASVWKILVGTRGPARPFGCRRGAVRLSSRPKPSPRIIARGVRAPRLHFFSQLGRAGRPSLPPAN